MKQDCSFRVKDLEQNFVDIYWPGHRRWYPGFLVSFDESSGFGEVEFEDGAFDNEIVESEQIRPRREMTVTNTSPSSTVSSGKQLANGRTRPAAGPPAGAFNHEQFLSYVCDLNAHSKSTLPVACIADPYVMARVKACMFSKHAEERILQRYPTRLQEFQRSLSTNQDCAILMDRRVMLCLPVRINSECSEEVGLVFNWEFDKFIEQRVPGKKRYLTKRNVIGEESICEYTHAGHSAADKVASALLARNRSASGTDNVIDFCAADISHALQYECYDMSAMVLTTTTSTLILSWDYKRLVTCFFNRIGYSDWIDRQRQRQAGVAKKAKAKAKAFTRAGKK